ncbi:MAG TPA: ATP synthase subunit I [Candidatus Latescibacteria bacterium]|nr:ATP synthase subunit I [Candidatus Latescibacterota bacterium]
MKEPFPEARRAMYEILACATGIAMTVGIILLATTGRPYVALGFWAGALLGMANFRIMARDVFKGAAFPPDRARGYAAGRYFLRYGILVLAVVLLLTQTELNPLATLCGLLAVQAGVYLWKFALRRRDRSYDQAA